MLSIHTSTTPEKEAATAVNILLDEHRHSDVLLLLSGGSALEVLPYIDTSALSERDTVSVLDERYTFDEKNSNMSTLTKTAFFERIRKQHVDLIDPRPDEDESLERAAKRFDVALKHWHVLHREGVVIATLGIGPDGHTSGVLPRPENPETFAKLFLDPHHCVCGYHVANHKNPYPERMTTTLGYLKRHIHHAIVYACGEQKRDALITVMKASGSLAETPARILHEMPDARIFTDLTLE
jgi:6-phosphogluconolactonase/glucosamine-6-phosphate isomerase/deaminase